MASKARIGFGVDIGGTGIKGAPVDLRTGKLLAERLKLPTPRQSTPDAVGRIVGEVVKHFGWTGPIGVTFPAVVKDGRAMTAANVDKSWIGASIHDAVRPHVRGEVIALNDADAAGLGEARFGAARGREKGVVLMVTLGTGIGSALMLDGLLFPSAELGHLEVDGKEAEKRAAGIVRERDDLSWKKWAKQLQKVLSTYEALFWPDLIVIGGGVSAESAHFLPLLKTRAELVPAALLNTAGIVGAAIWADELLPHDPDATLSIPPSSAQAATPTKVVVKQAPAKKATAKKATPARRTAAKETPARKTARKKAAAKRSAPAKKAAAKPSAPAKKAAPAKVSAPAKKATPAAKKTPAKVRPPAKKAAPVRKAAGKKAPAKRGGPVRKATTAAKKSPAKVSAPAKKVAPRKSAVVKKAAPAKKATAKRSAAARKTAHQTKPTATRSAPARKATTAAKKTAARRRGPARKATRRR